jgi:hypothetical protein
VKRHHLRSFLVLLPVLALGLTATCARAQEVEAVPPPTVTQPMANATVWTTNDRGIVIKGIATAPNGVSEVEAYTEEPHGLGLTWAHSVTIATPGARQTAFTARLTTSIVGTKVIHVRVRDAKGGISPTTDRQIRLRMNSPLTVKVDDASMGSVSPEFLGTTIREVGARYTIYAIAKKKPAGAFIFRRWLTDDLRPLDGKDFNPVLTFTHSLGLVLTAKFVPNIYKRAGGSYVGPVYHFTRDGIEPNEHTASFMRVQVTSTGAFSGAYLIEGKVHRFKGIFGDSRNAEFRPDVFRVPIERPGKPRLTLGLTMSSLVPLDPYHEISVSVDEDDGTPYGKMFAHGFLPHSTINGTTHAVPAALLGPQGAAAAYTVSFTATHTDNGWAGPPPAKIPHGSGLFNMVLLPDGTAIMAGRLADDTPMTASARLANRLSAPFFASLYNGGGYFTTSFSFTDSTHFGLSADGWEESWARPAMDTQHFPDGWHGGVSPGAYALRYRALPGRSILFTTSRINPPAAAGRVLLEVWPTVVGEPKIQKWFRVDANDVVTKLTPGDDSFTLSINRANGRFGGKIRLPDGTMPSFSGIVAQQVFITLGEGYLMTPTPDPKDYAGESMKVFLKPGGW